MKKVSFSELSEENQHSALKKMLDHNLLSYHPSSRLWSSMIDIQDDLLFGYNPDEDFYFYLDDNDEVVVHMEE
jgi:hypothetical protein